MLDHGGLGEHDVEATARESFWNVDAQSPSARSRRNRMDERIRGRSKSLGHRRPGDAQRTRREPDEALQCAKEHPVEGAGRDRTTSTAEALC